MSIRSIWRNAQRALWKERKGQRVEFIKKRHERSKALLEKLSVLYKMLQNSKVDLLFKDELDRLHEESAEKDAAIAALERNINEVYMIKEIELLQLYIENKWMYDSEQKRFVNINMDVDKLLKI